MCPLKFLQILYTIPWQGWVSSDFDCCDPFSFIDKFVLTFHLAFIGCAVIWNCLLYPTSLCTNPHSNLHMTIFHYGSLNDLPA